MRLTKEEIQFIDQYLKKSEVVFDDLRMELVDHVASAVSCKMMEEDIDFYDAFKSYMVENKKNILKAGMVSRTFNFTMAISKFAQFVITKEALIFIFMYLFLSSYVFKDLLSKNLYGFQVIIASSIFVFAILWLIVFYGKNKRRLFAVENNFIIMTFGYQLFNLSRFFWQENNLSEYNLSLAAGLFTFLFLIFITKTTLDFFSKNKFFYEIE